MLHDLGTNAPLKFSAATNRSSDPIASTSAPRVAAAWLGLAVAAVVLDASARSILAPGHAAFLLCAAAPLLIDRVAWGRLPTAAASATVSIAWTFGGAVLSLTAGNAGLGLLAWFVLPAAFASIEGRAGRIVGEAAVIGLLGGLGVGLARIIGVEPLGWSYGALPIVTAVAAAVAVALAIARLERGRRRLTSGAAVETRRLADLVVASPDVFLTVNHRDLVVAGTGGGDGKLTHDAAIYVGAQAASLFAEAETTRFVRALDRVRKFGDPERLVLAGEEGLIETRLTLTSAGEVTLALRPASPEVEALPKAERERDAASI